MRRPGERALQSQSASARCRGELELASGPGARTLLPAAASRRRTRTNSRPAGVGRGVEAFCCARRVDPAVPCDRSAWHSTPAAFPCALGGSGRTPVSGIPASAQPFRTAVVIDRAPRVLPEVRYSTALAGGHGRVLPHAASSADGGSLAWRRCDITPRRRTLDHRDARWPGGRNRGSRVVRLVSDPCRRCSNALAVFDDTHGSLPPRSRELRSPTGPARERRDSRMSSQTAKPVS